jgi:4-hydroxy-tetrahydrodipicolinate synthase
LSTTKKFSGVLAPVITPFIKDLSPDSERLLKHCQWLVSQNVGLAVFGTNSEANSLSTSERINLLDHIVSGGINPDFLMPGTGSCALSDTVTLTNHAVKLGCKGVLMLPPFFYKGVSDEGLFAFYSEVIERVADSKLQIYLYHIPPFSNIPLSVDLVDRLVNRYPSSIAGIKDSSGEWKDTLGFLKGGWPDFRVFCGSESFLLENMRNGGAGCISATANVNPAAINDLYEHWQSATAEEQQENLNQVRNIFQSLPMIPALKAATSIFGSDPDWLRVRPPIIQLNNDQKQALREKLDSTGFSMPGMA